MPNYTINLLWRQTDDEKIEELVNLAPNGPSTVLLIDAKTVHAKVTKMH